MKFRHIYKHNSEKGSKTNRKTEAAEGQNQRNGMFFYVWFEAMHTRIDIVICDKEEAFCLAITEKLISEISRIEKMANRFDPESELSRLNQLAVQQEVLVSQELFAIIADCIGFNIETAGAFDITIQSFNNFRSGIQALALNPAQKSIFFSNPNVQIDLCGYIKGYALDHVITLFKQAGIVNALINIGNSSIGALGNHPNGKGWEIAHPAKPAESITLHNACLSCSGNTPEYRHIINPANGLPCTRIGIEAIVTPTAIEGEVKATAQFVNLL